MDIFDYSHIGRLSPIAEPGGAGALFASLF
jgi:hypothetical protein